MNIFACYKSGIKEASSRPRIVLILWGVNAVFAAVAYVLFSTALASALGPSGAAAGLMKKPDMNVLLEALMGSGRPIGMLLAALFALLLLYFLASIFLQGGVLGGLVSESPEASSGRFFFESGARYYGRFVRLAVSSLILWIPAIVVVFIASAVVAAATQGSTNEELLFLLDLGLAGLVLFLVFFIKMIMDYARIRMAVDGSAGVFASLMGSLRFVFGRPGRTLGLYYLLGVMGLAIFALWRLVAGGIPATTTSAVWLVFLLTQLFIASRGWLQTAYQSAQLTNFRTHSPYAAAAPAVETPAKEAGFPKIDTGFSDL
jgi:hypothetical protein